MGWWAAATQVAREALGLPRPWTFEAPVEHTFDTAPQPVDRLITSMMNGAGPVSRTDAMGVPAVQRGRNELCTIATLPLRLYRGAEITPNSLFRQYDPNVPNVVHLAWTVEDLIFEGRAWWRKTGLDFDGYPLAVQRIDPRRVSMTNPRTGKVDAGFVWITPADGGGNPERAPTSLMIRFDSPNGAVLRDMAPTIRRAMALNNLATMYANNPALREWFTDKESMDVDPMTDEQIRTFLADYAAARQLSPTGWIPSNVERSDVSSPSPRDLTLPDLQRGVTLEIANGLGVDPEDLGVSTTSRTYQNAVDRKRDKIQRVYGPYMAAITDRLTMGDVTRYGYTVAFDLTDYLKVDPLSQAQYWKAMKELINVTPEWIAAQAGISPSDLAPPAPAAPPVVPSLNALQPGRRFDTAPAFTFAADDFADDAPAPTVDAAARTITGLAVPYNAVADKFGIKYRFLPGSLEYGAAERMPHLMDHATPVGFHRNITDGAAGPVVELAVLDGPEGSPAKAQRDQLLYDAQHGLYTGLSIGVDFSMDPEDGDVEIDADGVYNVQRATWRETSTTYMPAFDDARVATVAASRTSGGVMHCPHCQKQHAPNIACSTFARQSAPATPPAPPADPAAAPADIPGMREFYAQFAAQQAATAGTPPTNGPVLVNPHQAPAQVTEPAPYRFDRSGNLRAGSHDFSSDMVAGWKIGDTAARARVESFVTDYFERQEAGAGQQFAVTPANVTALNYPANRPDMYVDQLDYKYPLYNSVYKGTLDAVTPFVVPKFSSSSGLVADHVTGTEPTPGAFAATAQTITPTPVSGKVEITREAFDQGGNPQMSGLIWRQMLRGWYEALEAFAQAQLVANAASITDLTITTAAADATLDQAITDAFVPLQYIRGGDLYDTVFTQIDLYKAMVKAKDSSGRRLYPQIGAMNAVGTVQRGYTSLDAHGKLWVPAWALAASGSVAASSWMFNSDVVCLWASAPRKIELEWRVAWVDVGIWGYKAFAITDFTQTRELVYDPV